MSVYREKPKRVFVRNPFAVRGAWIPSECYEFHHLDEAKAIQWICPDLTHDEARLIAGAAHAMPLSWQTVERYIRLLGIK